MTRLRIALPCITRALVMASLALAPAESFASVVVPMTLVEMTRAAVAIIDAEVIGVHATADSGRIERVVSLRVTSRWKGEADEVVHVRLPGGTIGRTRTIVIGVPTLDEGDRVVLFLDQTPAGTYRILGLHQGAWRVSSSPLDGALSVGPMAPADRIEPGRVTRGDGTRRARRLEGFREDVQRLLEPGR